MLHFYKSGHFVEKLQYITWWEIPIIIVEFDNQGTFIYKWISHSPALSFYDKLYVVYLH